MPPMSQTETSGGIRAFSAVRLGVQEQTERRCPLDKFMQQAKSLGFQRTIDAAYPGDVTPGSVQARNQATFDRVTNKYSNDWYR
jgi:hypothetical protein